MKLSSLTAISPIDGRYSDITSSLRDIFSEFGLLKYRIKVEILWIQKLSSCKFINEIHCFNRYEIDYLNSIFMNFSVEDAKRIKKIEKTINHDMKAVEYFLKEKLSLIPSLKNISEFVHFACTSEDINNISYALMLYSARKEIILPIWKEIIRNLTIFAKSYYNIPMITRTHGQPATPSTVGKEIINFVYRMIRQYNQFDKSEILGKINGSVGNYNAHSVVYPNVNWHKISKEFITELGITWNPYTTQIEPHDYKSEIFSCIIRFNSIVMNLNKDMWEYISLGYFKQKVNFKEVGSSVMPHKVNPIDFEKSEGNIGISNAILCYMIEKLPISRLQRDLSDSTVLRNIGVGIGHSIIAYKSTVNGIKNLEINKNNLKLELNKNWVVLSEAIQTTMKRYGIINSYEIIKKHTRGKKVNKKNISNIINDLSIPKEEKDKLKLLTPKDYIGYSETMVIELIEKFLTGKFI